MRGCVALAMGFPAHHPVAVAHAMALSTGRVLPSVAVAQASVVPLCNLYEYIPACASLYRGTSWYHGTVVPVPGECPVLNPGFAISSPFRQAALRAHAMLLPASILALLSVRVAAVSLVTVATDATEGFCDLAWSAIVHGHVLHVLEWASAGAEFTVATSKMEALAAFAREAAATSPDELVLTVDGYDVIVQASPAAITRQVREVAPGVALGDTVLFSGENYCAPSFSFGGRPQCVAAYPKAAYHVSCSADHSM